VLELKGGDCLEAEAVLLEEEVVESLCTISPDSPLRTLARLGLIYLYTVRSGIYIKKKPPLQKYWELMRKSDRKERRSYGRIR
jgi:hypothetical protein